VKKPTSLSFLAVLLCGIAVGQEAIVVKHKMAPTVATPTFSSGSSSPITISDTGSGLSGFVMSYCTDGTNTCSPGTSYSTPVAVSGSGYIRAGAAATGYSASAVASEAYTIASTPTPNLGAGTACQHSGGSALSFTYTPAAPGDGAVFEFGITSTSISLTGGTITDDASSGTSTYVLEAAKVGGSRTGQFFHTLAFATGIHHLTITPSSVTTAYTVCLVGEWSNVSAFANYTAATFTGAAYSGTQLTCTLTNSTDYLALGGVATSAATGFSVAPNGNLTGDVNYGSALTWGQYVLDAQATGTLTYAGGSVNLMCLDVQ
jgi:hypothetical protein